MKKILLLICLTLAGGVSMAQNTPQKSSSIVTIAGEQFYVHTVAAGDTFYSLSKLYGCGEEALRQNNPHAGSGLKTGQVLKIPVQSSSVEKMSERKKNRIFDTHTVNQGETAYSISKRYGIALNVLMEDNPGFDPAHLSIGQQINIRIESQGKTDNAQLEQQMETYRDALNSVSEEFDHHVVAKGETLYSLSKQWNIPIDTIVKYNPAETKDGLKVGSILRLPAMHKPEKPATSEPEQPSGEAQSGVEWDTFIMPSPGEETQPAAEINRKDAKAVKNIDVMAPIKVVALLPMKVGSTPGKQFLEFYQGMLIALEELKRTGISSEIDLFNTAKSAAETESVLKERALRDADLIIGPVYDDCFAPVAEFAAGNGIPVVSPLAPVESVDNALVFQVAPPAHKKYDKLRDDLSAGRNVIVVSAPANDAEFAKEIQPYLPDAVHRINYSKDRFAGEFENHLSKDKENVIVVLSADESTTEAILARISSVQNNLIARSTMNPVIRVIGSSRWTRFQSIDKDLYFKLNLRYVTSYYAGRSDERVANFDRRYVAAFSSLPSLYAYRGYDVTKLFVSSMKLHGREFTAFINEREMPLLQTPYRFSQEHPGGKFVNGDWALVCYDSGYTITVK